MTDKSIIYIGLLYSGSITQGILQSKILRILDNGHSCEIRMCSNNIRKEGIHDGEKHAGK